MSSATRASDTDQPRSSVWRNAGFRRLFAAWASSNLADSALFLMAAVWVKDLTGSDSAAALVLVCFGLPAILAPLIGQVVDRFARRRVLVLAHLTLLNLVRTPSFS